MKKIIIGFICAGFIIGFVSCKGKVEKETEKKETKTADSTAFTTLTGKQLQTIGVSFGVIEQKQLTASLRSNGVLNVPNQNKAIVNSLYSGVVKTLLVQTGSYVHKGQTIATIANPQYIQMQEEYLTLDSKIKMAELEYSRQRDLNAGNAGALKNLQQSEADLKGLRTRHASLQKQLQLMNVDPAGLTNGNMITTLEIKAPIGGVVSNVIAKIGSFVDANNAIAEIVDNSQLHLDLFVYEKDWKKLKENQLIHFTITNDPGREYDARIFSIGSAFEAGSKTIPVHAMVQGNKTGLIDGMNITASVSLGKATMDAVPVDAIVSYQGRDYIFIESNRSGSDSTAIVQFERIPVAKGTTDIGYSEITPLKPVPGTSKIVVKGAFFILAKMTNSVEEE